MMKVEVEAGNQSLSSARQITGSLARRSWHFERSILKEEADHHGQTAFKRRPRNRSHPR